MESQKREATTAEFDYMKIPKLLTQKKKAVPMNPLLEMLTAAASRIEGETKIPMTQAEQESYISSYLSQNDKCFFKVGDIVEINEIGKDVYNVRDKETISVITDILSPTIHDGDIVNAQVMSVFKHDHDEKGAHHHPMRRLVDIRFFEKIGEIKISKNEV